MSHSPALAVVDDDPDFCRYLTTYLAARGYDNVRTYGHEGDFLSGLEDGVIPVVVLLDVAMPGSGGLAVLRVLRERHPDCQVVMISGHEGARIIIEALRLGAVDYVTKADESQGPVEERLEIVLRKALERADLAARVAAFRRRAPDANAWWHGSGPMDEVERLIDRVADCDATVLITGESGVGKEVVARAIHARSPRARAPFIKINCAALPAELLESELFGHERGAFTGAESRRMGKFEHAADGTILLDEIGEMSASLQAKLLHVLQDGSFTRLGSNEPRAMHARVLAATHRDLGRMIADGRFREDLFYRLRVIEIHVPPLRERLEELPAMTAHFLAKFAAALNRPVPDLPDELRDLLLRYPWPGNVRELENTVKRLVLLRDPELVAAGLRSRTGHAPLAEPPQPAVEGTPSPPLAGSAPDGEVEDEREDAVVGAADRPDLAPSATWGPAAPAARPDTLTALGRRAAESAERAAIQHALLMTRWNRRRAAEQLGVSYKTLRAKIKDLGITSDD